MAWSGSCATTGRRWHSRHRPASGMSDPSSPRSVKPVSRSTSRSRGRRRLPPGMDASAYRIVQEALTNALAHAGPATANVVIRYGPDDLDLEIRDTGIGPRETCSRRAWADRDAPARLVPRRPPGGGPRPGGGFLVRASLPLRAPGSMTIGVILADDERLVRAGFRMILSAEPDIAIVAEASDGREAVAAAREASARRGADGHPHAEPGRAGGDPPDPRLVGNPPRVIVLTTFDPDETSSTRSGRRQRFPSQGRARGAARGRDPGDSGAVRCSRRRSRVASSNVSPAAPVPQRTSELDQLTPRESEVLRLIARGLSNGEIAATLVVTEHTAKTHVAHILEKLGLRDRSRRWCWPINRGSSAPATPTDPVATTRGGPATRPAASSGRPGPCAD